MCERDLRSNQINIHAHAGLFYTGGRGGISTLTFRLVVINDKC